MRKTRKCAFCGKEFTCNSGSQRYCSRQCVHLFSPTRSVALKYVGSAQSCVFAPQDNRAQRK